VVTRPAVLADAAPFAAQMRAQDRAEFEALGDPAEDLAEGIRQSVWCYVAEDEGGYVAAWGVRPTGTLLGGGGYAWCATTPRVLLHRREFLLGSRAWVAAMRAEFDLLTGWCAADYLVSQRWLTRWLGFCLGETVTMPSGMTYVNFHWWRRD
jgi:hypothetical protein